MTGALVAHAFASAGVPVVLLERSFVGRGSTAASSALLLQEPDLELTKLAGRYGLRQARRIWELSRQSVRGLISLLTRLRVRCSLEARDSVYYASDAQGLARLRREYAYRTRSGFDAEWLDTTALRRLTGITGGGAIRTRGSAQFDPYRACLGVLGAAGAAGARIFEGSTARRISTTRERVRIHTSGGVVEADRVVIATGYATPHFRPLVGRFRMYRTYVLATEPLRAAARHGLGLADVMIWDTERPYHYARWTPDRRLLLGGGDRVVRSHERSGPRLTAATRELRAHFERQLPALADVDTPAAWEGLFAITPDSLPYIGPHLRYPRHWFALGYGGNGMTFSFMAARLLLERWHQTISDDHALVDFGRLRRRGARRSRA
jgi:glycine/D-amino acid oxidase-like deaminating enzyme